MPRYIDADELKHELCIRQHMLNADSLWKTLEIMDAQPTADVVERKKGKWYFRDTTRYGILPYICTVCGREANEVYNFCPNFNLPTVCSYCGNPGYAEWKFCPHCGCEMRKEKTDE